MRDQRVGDAAGHADQHGAGRDPARRAIAGPQHEPGESPDRLRVDHPGWDRAVRLSERAGPVGRGRRVLAALGRTRLFRRPPARYVWVIAASDRAARSRSSVHRRCPLSGGRPSGAGQVTARPVRPPSARPEPAGQTGAARRRAARRRSPPGRRAGLAPRGRNLQHAGLPVGLEVDPGDEPVTEQERQHVVAVHPLRRRDVDLDPVVEVEEPLGAAPLPDQRVERADQRRRRTRRGSRASRCR